MLTLLEVGSPTGLQILWFLLIAVLWIGFFFLEGFDFGVAMLYPTAWKQPVQRRVMVNSIGPTWDGNEVWLLTAGGATFAAFPGWYASLFSALYLPLLLVLLGLIIRGVSFEYRALMPDDKWRDTFDAASSIGSFIVSLVLGVGFANFVIGLPVDENHLFTGTFWSLFTPFALLGGVMLVVLNLTHGSIFLSLKTYGVVREKAHKLASTLSIVSAVLVTGFVVAQAMFYPSSGNEYLPSWGPMLGLIFAGIAVVGSLGAIVFVRAKRDGLAFIAMGLVIVGLFASIFVKMYGNLGFVSADAANPLDIMSAASTQKTLGLMRIAAFLIVPIVLAYQAWTYWVFSKRMGIKQMPPEHQQHRDMAHASVD